MNFYLGESLEDIKYNKDVEFSDELIEYIYNIRNQSSIDMSKLYNIDPYSDVIIHRDDLPQIVEICKYLIETSLIDNYEDIDEGKKCCRG